jgi:transposase, IS5 family
MRRTMLDQLPLVPAAIAHVHARELEKMSEVLDRLPEVLELVHADLVDQVDPNRGREGMTAEQVLRACVVKQMGGFSYEELAFHLADSITYRAFCRIGIADEPPSRSRLQKNIKRVSAKTWEAVNRKVVLFAAANGIESGQRVRTDCTVVDSNIHAPTDSSLLWDGVRVLVRLMTEARDTFELTFSSRRKSAKRRAMGILNARSNEQRVPLYKDLLHVTDETVTSAERIAQQLEALEPLTMDLMRRADVLARDLRHYVELTRRVISQTERRVLRGESVPATEKIVSIFEPHTDIIIKKNRETLYGHKICLTAGASGLVTDVVIERGNPADSTLAVKMIERQRELYGVAPKQVAFDGGFTSANNLESIKALGVEDVAFSKGRGLSITDMVKSSWVYRCLRNFRAGIEGVISFLKRAFALDRCTWSGIASFEAYVCGSVLACNLLVVARHMLASS